MRDRNIALERELTALAANAGGCAQWAESITSFSEYRAYPGGVRQRDFGLEVSEELADARNYAVWNIERVYDKYVEGDPLAADDYERFMRALTYIVKAWQELHTRAA